MAEHRTYDVTPQKFIDLEPAEFLKIINKDRSKFASFKIAPPELGTPGFGKIRGKLKVPVYSIPKSK